MSNCCDTLHVVTALNQRPVSKPNPNNHQVKKWTSFSAAPPIISPLLFLLLISPLSLFLSLSRLSRITPFSLVMPSTHLCVCVCACSHSPSRVMSMLMLILIIYVLNTGLSLNHSPPIFPRLCCTITHFPGHSRPSRLCVWQFYLESQHAHIPSCSPVCFQSHHVIVSLCIWGILVVFFIMSCIS